MDRDQTLMAMAEAVSKDMREMCYDERTTNLIVLDDTKLSIAARQVQ